MFFAPVAAELRALFRDVVQMPHRDAGDGWLIFGGPEGELGFHEGAENKPHISLYCDEIEGTVAELRSRGVEFTTGIEDHGYGWVTFFKAPGDLYIRRSIDQSRTGK